MYRAILRSEISYECVKTCDLLINELQKIFIEKAFETKTLQKRYMNCEKASKEVERGTRLV